mmetsp:Transcript_38241/g.109192  ORF Transcript_38241/g.109192 Transcript_38241/m.109192 type:complete len:83 (-) Transcript_38241:297-545(-)
MPLPSVADDATEPWVVSSGLVSDGGRGGCETEGAAWGMGGDDLSVDAPLDEGDSTDTLRGTDEDGGADEELGASGSPDMAAS